MPESVRSSDQITTYLGRGAGDCLSLAAFLRSLSVIGLTTAELFQRSSNHFLSSLASVRRTPASIHPLAEAPSIPRPFADMFAEVTTAEWSPMYTFA